MQILLEGRQVQEQASNNILGILADKYSREILEATIDSPKSAMDLSIDCQIPISTAYRRVQELCNNKLLGISGSINDDGKKYFLYRSKIKAVTICFNGGSLDVQIVPNIKMAENSGDSKFFSEVIENQT